MTEATVMDVEGRRIELGADGHLLDAGSWSEGEAEAMAERDGVELRALHW